jgi:hypothetical protein
MKSFTVALAATGIAVASAKMSSIPHPIQFEEFKKAHNKVYTSQGEHDKRREIFLSNALEFVTLNEALRAKGRDEIHGITKFADLTRAEFTEMYLGAKAVMPNELKNLNVPASLMNATAVSGAYNLSDDNLITAVKDQAQCGSW